MLVKTSKIRMDVHAALLPVEAVNAGEGAQNP